MFDKNFFPTPDMTITMMLQGIDNIMIRTMKILESSAGKGNIVDYLVEMKRCKAEDIDCIEKVPELCSILKEKKYRVISNDFLTFVPDSFYDLIIMNPPFYNGVKHLLKAIEISDGTEIRCLLNAESINNPYTEERKLLLKIIQDLKGTVENMGRPFKNSERKTDVEVVMVKIKVPEKKSSFEFERGHKNEREYSFDDVNAGAIAQKDYFGNLEIQYEKCKEIVAKIISLENELKFYGSYLNSSSFKNVDEILRETAGGGKHRYNGFVEKFRIASWDMIMNKTKIADLVTSEVKKNFYKFQQEQGYMAFTKENMVNLFEGLYLGQSEIMENCIIEAFDLMTKYHEENRVHVEGWKTNKSWKVTKKVILPNMRDNWNDYPCLSYQAREKLSDIEKAMSFILKKSYEKCNKIEDVFHKNNEKARNTRNFFEHAIKFGEWYDSEFFKFKIFKKGTMHIEFNDDFLYEQFNLIACKAKNWLPNMPGKKGL